jgi:hypothetical protein
MYPKVKKILAYTKDGEVFIPEIQIYELGPDHKAIPLRGYAYTQAVIDTNTGQCIGWTIRY